MEIANGPVFSNHPVCNLLMGGRVSRESARRLPLGIELLLLVQEATNTHWLPRNNAPSLQAVWGIKSRDKRLVWVQGDVYP